MATPRYVVVGHDFDAGRRFSMRRYGGYVVVSPDEIILVDARMKFQAGGAGVGLPFGILVGLVAGAVGAGIDRLVGPAKEFTTTLAEFPPEIRQHPDWPLGKLPAALPVLVLPRTAITAVAYSIWTVFEVDTETQTYHLHLSLLRRFRVMRIMRTFGYW